MQAGVRGHAPLFPLIKFRGLGCAYAILAIACLQVPCIPKHLFVIDHYSIYSERNRFSYFANVSFNFFWIIFCLTSWLILKTIRQQLALVDYLTGLHLVDYLTNRLHFSMCVYCNRSQMMSQRAKNKKVRHKMKSSGITVVRFYTLWHLWSITVLYTHMEKVIYLLYTIKIQMVYWRILGAWKTKNKSADVICRGG